MLQIHRREWFSKLERVNSLWYDRTGDRSGFRTHYDRKLWPSSNQHVTATRKTQTGFDLSPFPHINAFWRLCSKQLFENIVTQEIIAQNERFLILPRCFPLLVICYPFNYLRFSIFWQNTFKVVCWRIVVWGKGLIKGLQTVLYMYCGISFTL